MAIVSSGRMERAARAAIFAGALLSALIAAPAAQAGDLNDATCERARTAAFETGPALMPQPLTIVAVGSSSTEGIASNDKSKIYPAALQKSLTRLWPQADIKVVNKGKGGETMGATIARFETDVLPLKPSLVVWQLGVNDVLRFNGVEGLRDEIQSGLKLLNDRSIPVVLLDLQYAPMVLKDPDALPMQALIDDAARTGPKGRVFHFRRFAAMKDLAERNQVPMSEMTERDDLHMTDAMHGCIGQLLAEMIVASPRISISAKP
ncbi:MAG: SGNH/GDSL hydrolase family protein [Methylocystis sp.]|nr:SGNH/GDSL hydrolase family protein [Methylocystis sp.]